MSLGSQEFLHSLLCLKKKKESDELHCLLFVKVYLPLMSNNGIRLPLPKVVCKNQFDVHLPN